MQNDQKQYVDLYVPRRCYATNKLLDAKDHASVHLTLNDVSEYDLTGLE
jgi:small subunit ribosomal protein S21e